MTAYRLVADPRVDLDVAATHQWYESERAGLGLEFLHELSAAYDRIADDPFKYQDLESGMRRALLRRFPCAVYFSIENEIVVILGVLPVSRDPAAWRWRTRWRRWASRSTSCQ